MCNWNYIRQEFLVERLGRVNASDADGAELSLANLVGGLCQAVDVLRLIEEE